jgi:hypothetical protein
MGISATKSFTAPASKKGLKVNSEKILAKSDGRVIHSHVAV